LFGNLVTTPVNLLAGIGPNQTVLVMSIDHAMTVARLAADFGVSLEEIGDAMRRLDDPVRNRTVAQHVEVVLAETSSGIAGTYRRYWKLLVDAHGDRPVAELTVEHLRGITQVAEATKTVRANSNGTSLAENCVAELRRFMRWMFQSGRAPMSVAVIVAMGRSGSLISTS
jgi:ParB-like chromosome segregation protein Spo0J